MKYKNREEQRRVNEVMVSILLPMTEYCKEEVKECINIALQVLQETETEEKAND